MIFGTYQIRLLMLLDIPIPLGLQYGLHKISKCADRDSLTIKYTSAACPPGYQKSKT